MNGLHEKHSQVRSLGSGGGIESTDRPPYPHNDVFDPEFGTTEPRSLAGSTPGGTDQPRGGAQASPGFDKKGPAEEVGAPAVVAKEEKVPDANGGTLAEVGSSPNSSGSSDIIKAVAEAARKLALQCPFPGVCEAATLVSSLVNMIRDDKGHTAEMESRVKRCRLVIMILQRAAMVLGKVRTHGSCS